MVKITNGVDVFEVTNGAFDGIYSRQGYTKIDEAVGNAANEDNVPEMTEDEKFISEVREKPIGQWSKEEVKRFAAINGISLAGTKNAGEAKNIIKEFIDAKTQE